MTRVLLVSLAAALLLATNARAHPGSGIVVDRSGRIYFLRFGDHRIMTIGPDGRVSVFLEDERLVRPHHLVLDRDGNLYTVSDHDGLVWRIGPDGRMTQFFSSSKLWREHRTYVGTYGDPFTIDSAGNVYCLDQSGGRRIIRITPQGEVTEVGAGAQFGNLHFASMAWGPDGALYVSDRTRVWRLAADSTSLLEPRDVPLLGATGLAVDPSGNIYVADYQARRVVMLTSTGTAATPPGLERVRLSAPVGIAVGPAGELYVVDHPPRRTTVWKVTPQGASRIYRAQDVTLLIMGSLVTLIPLIIAAHTWVRKVTGVFDWLWWTAAAGALIAALYWGARAVPVFSYLRHAVVLVYVVGAVRSFRRARRQAVPGVGSS